jgi:hypothetical protein
MGMRDLRPGQWTPCGSGGGGDCIVLELSPADRTKIRVSDTDRTGYFDLDGHEIAEFVLAYSERRVPDPIMTAIQIDVAKEASER